MRHFFVSLSLSLSLQIFFTTSSPHGFSTAPMLKAALQGSLLLHRFQPLPDAAGARARLRSPSLGSSRPLLR